MRKLNIAVQTTFSAHLLTNNALSRLWLPARCRGLGGLAADLKPIRGDVRVIRKDSFSSAGKDRRQRFCSTIS